MSVERIAVTSISNEELAKKSPPILYKYRTWANPQYTYHHTILTECKVYMAPPSEFKDPKDCKSSKRYDLMTPLDIWNRHYQFIRSRFPYMNEFHVRQQATLEFRTSNFFDPHYVEWVTQDYAQKFDKHFGVLSLTANPIKPEMWIKYADNHSGICVGLDTAILFDQKHISGGGIVTYTDDLPIIYHDDGHELEHMKQVQFKESKWAFEDEYRTFKSWPHQADGTHRGRILPASCFKEVIFGAHIKAEHKKKIQNICKKQGMTVDFYQAYFINQQVVKERV